MIGLLFASALLSGGIQTTPPAAPQVINTCCSQRIRGGVEDPQAFVAMIYGRYLAHPNRPPPDPSIAYSRRLKGLFDAYNDWQRAHHDEVGTLDFDWWTNAQDYRIRNLNYRVIDEGPSLRWIVARFDNYDRHDEVRFRFVRQGGRWFLDDAMEGTGSGGNGWTLSALLQNPAG
jgi:hypothetical protein